MRAERGRLRAVVPSPDTASGVSVVDRPGYRRALIGTALVFNTAINVARMGKFSSDRAIREYCDKIWRARPISDR